MENDPLVGKGGLLGCFYVPDARDRVIFGDKYEPPAEFVHGEWHRVAVYPKTGSDGQPVEVHECRWPARFFMLRALADTDSVGKPKQPFTLSTGSGDDMGALVARLATAISEGMITGHLDTR